MGFVSIWTRQVARAAATSLIAPLALLLAAGVVASGGGLGGIGSLGQIASGPAIPDLGLDSSPASSLEGAEIVGAGVSEPGVPTSPAPPTGSLASAAPTSAASPTDGGAPPGGRRAPQPPAATIRPPAPPGEDGVRAPSAPSPPAAPNPGDDLLEATRGIGDLMPGPLGPITGDILNLLLGPPRP